VKDSEYKKRVRNAFSKAVNTYREYGGLQFSIASETADLIRPYMNLKSTFLDVGCGEGALARNLCDVIIIVDSCGLDASDAMCKKSSEYYRNIVCGDMDNMPFIDNAFDVVVSSLAIQWSTDLNLCFREIARVMKSNGNLIISIFIHNSLCELKESFLSVIGRSNFLCLPEKTEVEHAIEAAGMNIIYNVEQSIQAYYNNFTELLSSLRATGSYARRGDIKPLRKTDLKKLEQHYTNRYSSTDQGIYATWKVLYIVANN